MQAIEFETPTGAKKINRPSPQLLGSVKMPEDLILSAVPESDWVCIFNRSGSDSPPLSAFGGKNPSENTPPLAVGSFID